MFNIGNQTLFFVANFLFNAARVLPQAVLTIIFLDKGMSLSQMTIIQSAFMLAGLIFEFPSGVLSDRLSEKFMYQLSLVLITISYLIVMFSNYFLLLVFAWFVYGLAAASMSGSLDSYFIKVNKSRGGAVKPFMVKNKGTMLYSSLLAGLLGSFIYSRIQINIYSISILLTIVSFLIVTFLIKAPKTNMDEVNAPLLPFIRGSFLIIKNNRRLAIAISQLVLFQIVIQSFFQYWQIIFLIKHISPVYFGIAFFMMQLVSILGNAIFKRMTLSLNIEILLVLSLSVLFFMSLGLSGIVFIFIFYLFQVPFNIYMNQVNLEIAHFSPPANLSSIVSLTGALSTGCSVIILGGYSYLLKHVSILMIVSGSLFSYLLVSFLIFYIKRKHMKGY